MRPRAARAIALTTVAAVTGIVGLSRVATGSGVGSVEAPETTVATSSEFDAVDFFSDFYALVNADPYGPSDLSERIVAGSPADAFLTYVLGFSAARVDSRPGPFEPFTVVGATTAIEGTPAVELCSDGFCDTFSDFVVEDGRLQSFQLNGQAIDDRVASPAKAAEFGDVRIEVIGGFERTTVDELAVVIGVDPAGETLEVAWDEVVYVNPSGNEIGVDLFASAYPRVIEPRPDGRAQPVVLQFPTADLGGELVVPYVSGSMAPVEARVAVDELRP